MTITDQQLRALTYLAKGCRPNGAQRWDEAGTMAALTTLRDRDLATVILATIRAATDRDCDTPAVVPQRGQHWAEQLAPRGFVPHTIDRTRRCSVCSHTEDVCRMRWAGDHEFRSAAVAAKEAATVAPESVRVAVQALKAEVVETPPREPVAEGLEALADRDPELRARVDRLRETLPMPPMQETETSEPEESQG